MAIVREALKLIEHLETCAQLQEALAKGKPLASETFALGMAAGLRLAKQLLAVKLQALLDGSDLPSPEMDARTPEWKEMAGNLSMRRTDAKSILPSPEWQDISTAPKDTTAVLVWTARGAVVASKNRHSWWSTKPGLYSCAPTHWQPLPAPPSSVCVLHQIREET